MTNEEEMREFYYEIYHYAETERELTSFRGNEYLSLRIYKGQRYLLYKAFDEKTMKVGVIGINPEYNVSLDSFGLSESGGWIKILRDMSKFNIINLHYSLPYLDTYCFKDMLKEENI